MPYLNENQLSNMMDVPIALATTDLRMGDWVVIATVKIVTPMKLTYTLANLQVMSCTVDTALITASNKIYGNLGLVYLTLRKDYVSGSPGAAGGLDVLVSDDIGTVSRDTNASTVITAAGVYSWIIANNMQPSTDTDPTIPITQAIDFRLAVTGAVRLELNSA